MKELKDLYKQMVLIRKFEEKLYELFSKDLLFGTIHACIGQEAVAVGIANALDKSCDIVVSNHRGHGHYIAFSNDVEGLMAEIMGKKTGVVAGRGGSQHLYNNNFYSNGVQGGMVPIANGMALAEKMKKTNAIVICFIGDGTLGQGVVYESMNISSLWSLPIIYVLENNIYAMSTNVKDAVAGDIIHRAKAFNIDAEKLEGNDIEALYRKLAVIVTKVRNSSKPYFMCIDTYRFCGHSKSDSCEYRSREEELSWRDKDPLSLVYAKLPKEMVKKVEKECIERIEGAFRKCQKDLYPVLKNE